MGRKLTFLKIILQLALGTCVFIKSNLAWIRNYISLECVLICLLSPSPIQHSLVDNSETIYVVLGVTSQLEVIESSWEAVRGFQVDAVPPPLRDLGICHFWCSGVEGWRCS